MNTQNSWAKNKETTTKRYTVILCVTRVKGLVLPSITLQLQIMFCFGFKSIISAVVDRQFLKTRYLGELFFNWQCKLHHENVLQLSVHK